jgi:hypothetical protein
MRQYHLPVQANPERRYKFFVSVFIMFSDKTACWQPNAQQVVGREPETATLLSVVLYPDVACLPFPPTQRRRFARFS